MKKKILLIIGISLLCLIALFTWFRSYTKSHSPAETITCNSAGFDIAIQYCKPYRKGRLIFGTESQGALQPYGKYWRIGANEATRFESKTDLLINGNPLPAGIYSIYAFPDAQNWKLVWNKDADRWGVPAPDSADDVLTVSVPAQVTNTETEQLALTLTPSDSAVAFTINWEQTLVAVTISKP